MADKCFPTADKFLIVSFTYVSSCLWIRQHAADKSGQMADNTLLDFFTPPKKKSPKPHRKFQITPSYITIILLKCIMTSVCKKNRRKFNNLYIMHECMAYRLYGLTPHIMLQKPPLYPGHAHFSSQSSGGCEASKNSKVHPGPAVELPRIIAALTETLRARNVILSALSRC